METKGARKSEKGLTLIEILIAILIFILATVFIVALVGKAIDKPKVAGIQGDLKHYEDTARLVFNSAPKVAGVALLKEYLNEELGKSEKFGDGDVTLLKNGYNNTYSLTVVDKVEESYQAIVIETRGSKVSEKYQVIIIKEGGVVDTCTTGFGRNNKELSVLDKSLCGSIGSETGTGDGGGEVGGGDTASNPIDNYESTTEVPAGYNEIWVPQDLWNVRTKPTQNWIVMADIDLSTFAENEGG